MKAIAWSVLLISLACGSVIAASATLAKTQKSPVPISNADFARGAADATAAFASGHPGIYIPSYSNMPNGPDDPVLARARDLQVAVMREKGIEPHSSSTGCIPVPGLPQYVNGYNSVAQPRLAARFGPSYMDDIQAEVARRMK